MSLGGESPEIPPRPAGAVPGSIEELRGGEPVLEPYSRGTKTTEFRLALAGLVVAAILAWRGAHQEAAELAGWCVAGYGVSRGLAKLRAP